MRTTSSGYLDQGRVGQKLKTRQRVLEAAAELISGGGSPTVAEAADHAKVSRRTAYRYFQTQQLLLAEAALVIARRPVQTLALPSGTGERLDATVRTLQKFVYENEVALRLLAQQSMQHSLSGRAKGPPRANRVRFIEEALANVRGKLRPEAYERLISALVLCMGIEAAMSLRYLRSLTPAKATDVCSWAAQQILRGAMESE